MARLTSGRRKRADVTLIGRASFHCGRLVAAAWPPWSARSLRSRRGSRKRQAPGRLLYASHGTDAADREAVRLEEQLSLRRHQATGGRPADAGFFERIWRSAPAAQERRSRPRRQPAPARAVLARRRSCSLRLRPDAQLHRPDERSGGSICDGQRLRLRRRGAGSGPRLQHSGPRALRRGISAASTSSTGAPARRSQTERRSLPARVPKSPIRRSSRQRHDGPATRTARLLRHPDRDRRAA